MTSLRGQQKHSRFARILDHVVDDVAQELWRADTVCAAARVRAKSEYSLSSSNP
jgi:hypothetical protein